jgi:ribonuclease G
MRKDIIINANPHEIRIGIREDGLLVETLIERADSRRIVGNLYRGVVSSVKPGLQAAFVDIGLERAGFLHASDLVHEEPDDDDEAVDGPAPATQGRRRRDQAPEIGTMLKVGDEILVQVTKEPISSKGPRLTADVSLPGRFLVHMPKGSHVGVSRKIEDRAERARLKKILQESRPDDTGAFIIRTAAENADEKAIRTDVKYLSDLWHQIEARDGEQKSPCLVHEDVGMVVGLIRDVFKEDVDELVIDDAEDFKRLQKYVKIFAPELKNHIRLYKDAKAIFEHYDIEQELRRSTEPRVWLKKGGYIIIEQTEAMVSVDVNTGRFTGRSKNQEDTIIETNLLAAREVARQLRLRDIGGIIVIDFIDMENEGNKKRVLNELRNCLKRDRARTKVFPVSNLGLVEMSRQRVRPSLVSFLSDDCPYCKGGGKVLSLATLANRVEREVHRVFHKTGEQQIQVVCNPMLALYMLKERQEQIEDLAEEHALVLEITDDPALHREAFQVVSLRNDKDLLAEADKRSAIVGRGRGPHAGGDSRRRATAGGTQPRREPRRETRREPAPVNDAAGDDGDAPQRPRREPRREVVREPRRETAREPRREAAPAAAAANEADGDARRPRRRGRRGGRRRTGGGTGSSEGGGED